MKKRAILFGAASLALAASPIMGFSAFAGVTDNPGESDARITRTTINHDAIFADLTFGQRYTFTGETGQHMYGLITIENEQLGDNDPNKNKICGYIIDGAWLETGTETDDKFCFEKKAENTVDFYQVSDAPEEVKSASLDSLLVWDIITFANANANIGSDVILVGDIDDLDHAYQNYGNISIETNVTPLNVFWGQGYALMDGANQEHIKKSGEGLTFHATGSFEDSFDGVLVDGEEIETYEGKSGSTIITLPADYLDTLSIGSHTLTIRYAAHGTIPEDKVEVDFIVSENPETASGKNIIFAAFVSVICLSGVAATMVFLKERR